ncbi:MAG: PHP domain-containing protein [Erysipelotrichaceae bacterium]|nr:PHP domain-containing protein [Erysipelotrichaceae bacterium]MDY5252244.1 PHP domain-containing protein [Erysipelotrichaceae bacterium]
MKSLIDLHVHTLNSGHAYSTMLENVAYAQQINLKYLGMSDHAPMMPGSAHIFYFNNMGCLPDHFADVRFLKGAEANLLNEKAEIDLDQRSLARLDYTIASIHSPCYRGNDITSTYLRACDDPNITVLGHIENGRYPCDFDQVCAYAAKTNTLIELNNSSLRPNSSRLDAYIHMPALLAACKRNHTYVLIGSDAHFAYDINDFSLVEAMMAKEDFPLELVVNYDENLIEHFLLKKIKRNMK